MRRKLILSLSLVVAASTAAMAQVHPGSHSRERHHPDSAHTPMDSATHALLHRLLHGTWEGTLTSHNGAATPLQLMVAQDAHRKLALRVNADRKPVTVAAGTLAVVGKAIQWTQDRQGTPCKMSALLPDTSQVRPTMKGTMKCQAEEMTFTLRRASQ